MRYVYRGIFPNLRNKANSAIFSEGDELGAYHAKCEVSWSHRDQHCMTSLLRHLEQSNLRTREVKAGYQELGTGAHGHLWLLVFSSSAAGRCYLSVYGELQLSPPRTFCSF